MKLLAWLCGLLVVLLGMELAESSTSWWHTWWFLALLLWSAYGAGIALFELVYLVIKRAPGAFRIPHTPKKEGE
jgi:hypothetical protein